MKTRFWGWMLFACLCLPLGVHAQLVVFPQFTSISVPPSATKGDTVSISATAEAFLSDNSDGNDWNSGEQATIYKLRIEYQAPGGGPWITLNEDVPHENPSTVTVNLTLDAKGTWLVRFIAEDGRPWWTTDQPVYSIKVDPLPGPIITSSLSVSKNEGEYLEYEITATHNPTTFGATKLPDGLIVDPSSGWITGVVTSPGEFDSIITAANSDGTTDTQTLHWSVTAASIIPDGSVAPNPSYVGTQLTFTRAGTANFGINWTENRVVRPDGSVYDMGNLQLGTTRWVPDGGEGPYTWQYVIVDSNFNSREQDITFTLSTPTVSVPDVKASTTGSTFVTLTWSDSTSPAGIDHYDVYRDSVFLNSTLTPSYTDTTANPQSHYTYTIIAVDTLSRVSDPADLTVTTLRPLEVFTPLP